MIPALALATLAVTTSLVSSTPAEARRGFGFGSSAPRCFTHYEPNIRWCGIRNGKNGCWKGRYVVICK